ncbi:hypothetical protein CDAR_320361 [Caerostris darwini]|uniref:Uncharacterized protein n=1 Tax=Caerostris darwini TaxID=1538125 RepID=A0AAV4PJ16_9ARAC|nr:hypothetical protein CDAR_320361 [Caerostris darwini]
MAVEAMGIIQMLSLTDIQTLDFSSNISHKASEYDAITLTCPLGNSSQSPFNVLFMAPISGTCGPSMFKKYNGLMHSVLVGTSELQSILGLE